MKYIYGVDLGGTTVKMGLFDQEGTMLEKWEIVTRKENNGELLRRRLLTKMKKSPLIKVILLVLAWVCRDRSQRMDVC